MTVRKYRWSGAVLVLTLAATLSGCGGGASTQASVPVATLLPVVSGTPTPTPQPKAAKPPKATPTPAATSRPAKPAKPAAPADVVMLHIKNFMFSPQTVQLRVGQTLVVINDDTAVHTITSDDGSFDSGNLEKGQSFTFTPTKPGTYTYICDLHQYMTGTIEVS